MGENLDELKLSASLMQKYSVILSQLLVDEMDALMVLLMLLVAVKLLEAKLDLYLDTLTVQLILRVIVSVRVILLVERILLVLD